MKKIEACPKCGGTDVIRVPGGSTKPPRITVAGFNNFVPVTRYVCGGYGFGEQWLDSTDDIVRVRKAYPKR